MRAPNSSLVIRPVHWKGNISASSSSDGSDGLTAIVGIGVLICSDQRWLVMH